MSDTKKLTLSFGALADSLADQIEAQGFKIDKASTRYFQRAADAITELYLKDVLTDGETRKARQRLVKRVGKALEGDAK